MNRPIGLVNQNSCSEKCRHTSWPFIEKGGYWLQECPEESGNKHCVNRIGSYDLTMPTVPSFKINLFQGQLSFKIQHAFKHSLSLIHIHLG